jgi:CheY-like chemotaxis protein
MAGARPKMVVFGSEGAAVPMIRELTGERTDVLNSSDVVMPQAVADFFVFDTRDQQLSSDIQVCAMGLLSALPDGVVLLNKSLTVLWHNQTFRNLLGTTDVLVGRPLHDVIAPSDGTDLHSIPVPTSVGEPAQLTVRRDDRRYLGLRLARTTIALSGDDSQALILTVRDVTRSVAEKQKQQAIYKAGLELGNLTAEEVTAMRNEERVALLKDQILQLTQEVLGYDTFEIRVLDQVTNELLPLLEFGMDPEAARRQLFAAETGNGVTGFVAFSKKSYLCGDTKNDPLYLCGKMDARSSLTVPLMIRDSVLGTFNVESPGSRSFDQMDLDFLTLFGRVVASSLNQLQLLAAEKVTTEAANTDRLRREVAEPTDQILSACMWILDRYVGHDPDVNERLQLIASLVRKISASVGAVSPDAVNRENSLPPVVPPRAPRKALEGKRILVIDHDATARQDAHDLLGQMGCQVEAVQTANDAYMMLRTYKYDVVLTDVQLPDATGYECFRGVRDIDKLVPIIMMTAFGYDASHSIVKARQEGMKAALYKPFRRAQLLDEVEKAVTPPPPVG